MNVLCCLFCAAIGFAQSGVKGKVTDENGIPLTGVIVSLGTDEWTDFTDLNGEYEIMGIGKLRGKWGEFQNKGLYYLDITYAGYYADSNSGNSFVLPEKDSIIVADIQLKKDPIHLNAVIVSATRANHKAPFTIGELSEHMIKQKNIGQDIPYLLDDMPSLVAYSDAGAGIGYTGMRIRGTDPTRINVTINGIPLNDAESQGVFWVDIPDFASSTNNIQVQRGVGSSTNGAGAFGATISLNTSKLNIDPFAEISGTTGSFNTWRSTASFGTGLLNKKTKGERQPTTGFAFDGRLSKIISDGYIDRAAVEMDAYFVSGVYIGKKSSLRANVFSGHEVTYQAWNGVPTQYVDDDKLRKFNVSGTDYFQELENPHDNEVDDYTQTNYQLLFAREINHNWNFSLNGHYTRGLGFFEQYKIGENLIEDYGLDICDTCNAESDLIRRRWLDNHFYGGVWSLAYLSNDKKIETTFGGGYNEYKGDHLGEIIWAENMPGLRQNERYYFGVGDKNDFNVYGKLHYELKKDLFGYLDLQYRKVGYKINGTGNDLRSFDTDNVYHFFNPKIGFKYFFNTKKYSYDKSSVYGSFAVANKEPNRSDFTDAPMGGNPQSEGLYNIELGYYQGNHIFRYSANFYYMGYKNQLVLTGDINDVGAPIRTNISDSHRYGIELWVWRALGKGFLLQGNVAFSQNKIKDFTEYIDNWDTKGQEIIEHGTTDIAFSPNITANASLEYRLYKYQEKELNIILKGQYVGEQFIDNTSNKNTILDNYLIGNFQIRYEFNSLFAESISFNLLVNNIFDKKYSANAWTYRYISNFYDGRDDDPYTRSEGGGVYNLTGYYPQAGRHFLLGMTVRF